MKESGEQVSWGAWSVDTNSFTIRHILLDEFNDGLLFIGGEF
jgi:hypothetical protein